MALWNTKFDHVNGEQRECKICGVSFHTIKPRYTCNQCVNANQKIIETKKRSKYAKKENYPFDTKTHEAGRRFCSIRTATSNAWKQYNKTGDRSIITKHYDKQLKEIQENGIMTWILDRRCLQAQSEKHVKTKGMIRKEHPDTRGHYEY